MLKVKSSGKSKGKLHSKKTIILPGTTQKPESQMTPIEKMERLSLGISKKNWKH